MHFLIEDTKFVSMQAPSFIFSSRLALSEKRKARESENGKREIIWNFFLTTLESKVKLLLSLVSLVLIQVTNLVTCPVTLFLKFGCYGAILVI